MNTPDDPAPNLEHFLVVTMRGNCDPVLVRQETKASALAAVRFAAELLRKAPADRACCWAVTSAGIVTTLSETGVATQEAHVVLAAFDPREVVSVQVVSRAVEAWKAGA